MPLLHTPREDAPVEEAGALQAERVEAQLVGRVARGERQAFEQLYRAYHPRLTRFLDRMTRRSGLIGELLNDTMFVVWTHAGRYNGQSKVSTWIFAIAYRKALKAMSRWDEPVPDPEQDHAAETAAGPEQRLAHAQLRDALALALAGLSVEQRAMVDLCYHHGIGYREIGEVIGCPAETVKTRMFYARQRLRSLLPGRPEDWL
ncbi:MAG TPA: sigma-70 family RNA polymerase sigma factor [Ideonella sp.]|jgi:RNA polymerase sigma-70 factor (ECF subfamily)|nr:sigma-70 family RNA polymerase sigma factor [Ideonella sp.]